MYNIVYLMTGFTIYNRFGLGEQQSKANERVNNVSVCRPALAKTDKLKSCSTNSMVIGSIN